MKLWGGRFTRATAYEVDEFNASISFDQQLAPWDIQGSLAHARALARTGVLTHNELDKISAGLQAIAKQIEQDEFTYRIADEDIHMNIERALQADIGELAGKLHTGRSRNDQVALDMHLYCRSQVLVVIEKMLDLQQVLIEKAAQHIDTIMPGYTHMQRAQPVRLAHHLLAYGQMLLRDVQRLQDSMKRINLMPLGAGALAGSGYAIDRQALAADLHFEAVYENSMDAVSDRDFVVEFHANAALIMMHLSRLSEELILWSSQEFAFIELDDAYATGSSMMPQKKNPDVAELVRGKTGRVYGHLQALLTTLKALPLTYNKDMQEDKEGLFDTVTTLIHCLSLYAPMMATMTIHRDRMRQACDKGFVNATDLADYLVKKGMPFRQAHEVVGKIVLQCQQEAKSLTECPLEEYRQYSTLFEQDLFEAIDLDTIVDARAVQGGTAKKAVLAQLAALKQQQTQARRWLSEQSLNYTCLARE